MKLCAYTTGLVSEVKFQVYFDSIQTSLNAALHNERPHLKLKATSLFQNFVTINETKFLGKEMETMNQRKSNTTWHHRGTAVMMSLWV